TTWEDLVEKFVQKFYQLSDNNEEMETDEDDDLNDIANIFKIEGNLFDFETPLNHGKITGYHIRIKTYEEYELNNNMTGDLEEPWSDNGDQKWYDELTDGKPKEEAVETRKGFKMMKYSFDVDDEYVAIKEHEHSDHSRTNVDACQAYRELFRIMDEGWLLTKGNE
ncbi:hypothetical protein Tco_0546229, partial [Tanacetum coccineum]